MGMGQSSSALLPDGEQRSTYFHINDNSRVTRDYEPLSYTHDEMVCCPQGMAGCTIIDFRRHKMQYGTDSGLVDDQLDTQDGEIFKFKIKVRASHSKYIPRYQVHQMHKGRSQQEWVVGHLEKTETHLRAKPGEFLRVQVWTVTANAIVMKERRGSALRRKACCSRTYKRPTPDTDKMHTATIAITTQAKLLDTRIDEFTGEQIFVPSSAIWRQTIGTSDSEYSFRVRPHISPGSKDGPGRPAEMRDMSLLEILHRGEKVCVARKQDFQGEVAQPWLGVQCKKASKRKGRDGGGVAQDMKSAYARSASRVQSERDQTYTRSLYELLMCLAWSEETMSPLRDHTDRFVTAMNEAPGDHGSAVHLGLSVAWDVEDVRQRLRHLPFSVPLIDWNKSGVRQKGQRQSSQKGQSPAKARGPDRADKTLTAIEE